MGEFPTLVQFRTGQHLTSALLRAEQEFHRTLLERHAISAHEWGVAEGLELTADFVEPGLAYDGFGRPLVLAARSAVSAASYFDLYDVNELDVALVYSAVVDSDSGVVVETPTVQVVPADPSADRREPPKTVPLAQGFDASREAPHDTGHPWPVYLGTVARDPASPDKPPTVRTDGRPFVGVRAARMVHPATGDELNLQAGAAISRAGKTVLSWNTPDGDPELRASGALVSAGEVTARGVEITPAAPNAATPDGWSLQRVVGANADELRVVFGATAASPATRFVVGATVDGRFKPFLTVQHDGTVTIDGNLVVTGDLTVDGEVKP